jgi:hypothetical protein
MRGNQFNNNNNTQWLIVLPLLPLRL